MRRDIIENLTLAMKQAGFELVSINTYSHALAAVFHEMQPNYLLYHLAERPLLIEIHADSNVVSTPIPIEVGYHRNGDAQFDLDWISKLPIEPKSAKVLLLNHRGCYEMKSNQTLQRTPLIYPHSLVWKNEPREEDKCRYAASVGIAFLAQRWLTKYGLY
ncbi:hypothetical protein [Vibrio sonorensis]|uniref:hypothetical protein n=1 Tax=Vibrio sonorensis TaxID=1004316 RepID=UPI0008D989AC|nr:hypothetical protein [Vibrio sonorensis]